MKSLIKTLGLLAALILCTREASAQVNPNLERGLTPYGSYEGGAIDSVNMRTGNLFVHIPLASYSQRGGKLSMGFFIRYNSKAWRLSRYGTYTGATPSWTYDGSDGIGAVVVRDQEIVSKSESILYKRSSGDPGQQVYFQSAVTSDGSAHQIGSFTGTSTAPYTLHPALDGTGVNGVGTPTTNGFATIVDRQGIRYSGFSADNVTSEDPNGNRITASASSWTDTLGRVIPKPVATTNFSGCSANTVEAKIWNLPGPNGSISTYKLCFRNWSFSTFFQYYDSVCQCWAQEASHPFKALQDVILPNGTKWTFAYNGYADVTSITFPTGGRIDYTWTTNAPCNGGSPNAPLSRYLVSRTLNPNDGSGPKTWNYGWGTFSGANNPITNISTDPAGHDTRYFLPFTCDNESKREHFQGSASTGTLLKTVETTYQGLPNPYASFYQREGNASLPTSVTATWPTGQVSKTQTVYEPGTAYTFYDYGAYFPWPGCACYTNPAYQFTINVGSVLERHEFDYGSGAPGPLVRKTLNSYLWVSNSSYKSANLLDLLSSTVVQDGTGTQIARTDYGYDETAPVASGITTQHLVPPSNGGIRGNQTRVSRWLNTTSGSLTSNATYNDTGTVNQATDPGGHTTTYSYSTAFAGAYVTQTQLPNTGPPTVIHIVSGNYDFNTGLLTSFTDENAKTSTYSYDTMFRIAAGNFPDGGQATISYNDAILPSATLTKKITATQNFVATNRFDGFGRLTRSELSSDPQGTVITTTTYDGLGRKATVSNPYRSTGEPTYGVTAYQYDALGRVTKVIPPDGTSTTNNITTAYSGSCTTVSDQAGKTRKSCADALGRLVEVSEGGTLSHATVATGSVTISGYERSTTVNFCPPMYCPNTFWDSGQVSITVNGFTASASYGQSSTAGAIATSLAATLNSASSPVTASASGSVVNLTAKLSGSAHNYPLSATSYTSQPQYFPGPSFSATPSGSTLTGGSDPSYSQSGALTSMYSYDTLDNLICVVQKGTDTSPFTTCASAPATWRPRSFTYNSLSQFTQAVNPESGTIAYSYDNDGNLLTKTAPAPNQTGSATVTTTFSYDALHRLTQKSFSDSTPVVKYSYDAVAPTGCAPPALTITNGIGRRTGMCDGAGAEAWSYDAMGRPLTDKRTTNSVTKDTLYTYNLDGSLATLTYPSGRTITYSYNAAARATSAVDTANSINYATAASYAPTGALASLANGASLVSTFYYNSRLQPCRISAKSSGTAPTSCADTANVGNILDFTYGFNLGTANNGNVASIANNRTTARSQSLTYDELNRIKTAQTSSTTGQHCWGESFGYDIWANLLTIGALTGYTGCTQENLSLTATTKNQISGDSYDSAGNLLSGPGMGPFTYDAENRLLTAGGVTYTYDGDGRRAKKSNAKLYWYGMGSDPLTETDLAGTPSAEFIFFSGKRTARLDLPGAAVHYYFSNHLGSASAITSATGTIQDESDYYPFGGERTITNTDPNQYKFTGKERDSESNLDYFGARYYAAFVGRFTTPDPLIASAAPGDPQSWNRYAYVLNNPLALVDPDGLETTPPQVNCNQSGSVCPTPEDQRQAEQVLLDAAVTATFEDMPGGSVSVGVAKAAFNILAGAANAYSAMFDFTAPQAPIFEGTNADEKITMAVAAIATVVVPGMAETKAASGVQANRAAGNAFRDQVANSLRAAGRDAKTEVTKQTPFGSRVIDIEVKHNGKTLGGVETKTGKSPYTPSQRAKDAYLKQQGYPVNLVRKRSD